jgi:dihydropteroate synthase
MESGATVWRTARGAIVLDRPRIAGILNVTPDSFWDGGRHEGVDRAVSFADRLIEEGADLIDVGGESTRPGASHVNADLETARVIPVIEAIARRWPDIPLSIDTVKAEVARRALDAGACIVNDVSALRLDPTIATEVARAGAGLILMHSRGGVPEMAKYETAVYGADPVAEMAAELAAAAEQAVAAGVGDGSIVVDPGLGFSKTTTQSVAALGSLGRFTAIGYPVMVGPSRKRFIGEVGARGGEALPVGGRLEGTVGACVAALFLGALLFRVHDVCAARRALDVAAAIRRTVP